MNIELGRIVCFLNSINCKYYIKTVQTMKWVLLSSIVIGILSLYLLKRNQNNVCKTFRDYYTDRDRNENCYHNPEADLKVVSTVFSFLFVCLKIIIV